MILNEEKYTLDGKEITIRTAREDEAEMLIAYLKTVSGETRFLMNEPDEIHFTIDEEKAFIKGYNDARDGIFLLCFVDGDFAGTCSFKSKAGSRRAKHRAGIGIALLKKYTGFGLGRLFMSRVLQLAEETGFEQIELGVFSGNERARRLYKSLGFEECGKIPNASKYDDGAYNDEYFMIKRF